jgi:hypothetical protein
MQIRQTPAHAATRPLREHGKTGFHPLLQSVACERNIGRYLRRPVGAREPQAAHLVPGEQQCVDKVALLLHRGGVQKERPIRIVLRQQLQQTRQRLQE